MALMTAGRSLVYLSNIPIEEVKGMRGARGRSLRNGGIESVADLLLHTPRRYIDRSTTTKIGDAPVGPEVTIVGTVTGTRTRRPRRNLTIVDATVMDETGIVTATWFNQGFRSRQLSEGAEVALSGKLERFKGKLQMKSPAADVLSSPSEALITGRVVPVHPSVGEVGPGHLRRAVHNALGRSRPVHDPLPAAVLERHDLSSRDGAIADIHFPETMADAKVARRRLVFDEFFRIEVALAMAKHRKGIEAVGVAHTTAPDIGARFLAGLPYPLTGAQERAIETIRRDMAEPHPMQRLLQGEVGSGKTVVAVGALLTAVDHGGQAAVMAPTEVLATQHYLGITELLDDAGLAPAPIDGAALGMDSLFESDADGVTVALLTGSQATCNAAPGASRADLLGWIADGTIDLVIGTHALIQEGVAFHGLTAAVVDEQHRFGVHQRVSLKEKAGDIEPDLLIMTATPIPRTLSMTLYGDLDVTVLDELPPGRSPIETIAVSRSEEDTAWELVRQAVSEGRQAFVVCPLVEESDKVEANTPDSRRSCPTCASGSSTANSDPTTRPTPCTPCGRERSTYWLPPPSSRSASMCRTPRSWSSRTPTVSDSASSTSCVAGSAVGRMPAPVCCSPTPPPTTAPPASTPWSVPPTGSNSPRSTSPSGVRGPCSTRSSQAWATSDSATSSGTPTNSWPPVTRRSHS
jgi:ATP-dependent DNA helicase RecG